MINIAFKKFSKFIIKSDNSSWVLDELKKEIEELLRKKYHFLNSKFYKFINHQNIFFINKYDLLNLPNKNLKIAVSYFHTEKNNKQQVKDFMTAQNNLINFIYHYVKKFSDCT